jgi:hypothetical protein
MPTLGRILKAGYTIGQSGYRLTTCDRGRSVEHYVERARVAFFLSPSSSTPMSTFDAFHEAGKVRPTAASSWLESLAEVPWKNIQMIFEQIPGSLMSDVAIEFALKMLDLNRQRLLGLHEEFR